MAPEGDVVIIQQETGIIFMFGFVSPPSLLDIFDTILLTISFTEN